MEIFDHDKGRVAVAQKLRGVGFDSTKNQKFFMIAMPVTFTLGAIFIGVGTYLGFRKSFKVPSFKPGNPIEFPTVETHFHVNALLIFGIIFMLLSIGLFAYFGITTYLASKKNNKELKKYGFDLHQAYFDAALTEKYKGLKIKNYQQGNSYHNHSFKLFFDMDGNEISWTIDEDIETRTETNSKGEKESYDVYILKSFLENEIPAINGFAPIDMAEGNSTKMLARGKYWQSESIEFNKRYCVSYEDELQMVKLFSPKIIDNFNKSLNDFSGKQIHLENGACNINYHSNFENIVSNHPNFLDWTGVDWQKKNNHIKKIAEKITLDFTRFEESRILLDPFEFSKEDKQVTK